MGIGIFLILRNYSQGTDLHTVAPFEHCVIKDCIWLLMLNSESTAKLEGVENLSPSKARRQELGVGRPDIPTMTGRQEQE